MLINFFFFSFLFIFVVNLKTLFFSFPIFYFFAPLGFLLFLKDILITKLVIKKQIIVFFSFLLLAVLANFISYLTNQDGDFLYLRQVYLYILISFFYAYFLIKLFFCMKNHSLDKLILFFLVVVATQLLVSFILFLNSSLFDLFFSFFDTAIGYTGVNTVDDFNEQRMIAIGNPFFGSAIVNCFSLIILAIQFKYTDYKKSYIVLWSIISILGIASARTTIIGVLISFLVILSGYRKSFKYIAGILILALVVFNFLYFTNERVQTIIDFSFSFLFDFRNSQASDSTGELMQMLNVLPNNVKTWLVGDNFFQDGNGYYYKGIDIGYSRIIFANGILGLIVFLLMHFYMFYQVKFDKKNLLNYLYMFMVVIALNFKGVANFASFIMVLFIYTVLYASKKKV
ncbi:hypothetical protein [Acinetobacter junii]|uniref:hypothetical protein n=2 Tax=Acinetobacter junii TaxID=40215 RepID=UPI0024472A8B|nr:hypothetical protein [Acinetobacter junii]MDH1689970.1 hypothetical protein [Acinetobacter junii]